MNRSYNDKWGVGGVECHSVYYNSILVEVVS